MNLDGLFQKGSFSKLTKKIEDDDSAPFEAKIQSKAGDIVDVHVKAKTINIDSKPEQLILTQNITEFIKTRKSLEESEEKHRMISSLLSDYVYTCTIRPNEPPVLGWTSGAMKKISGYADEELAQLEHGWFSIVHPEDVAAVAESVNYNYKDDSFYSNEYRIICKSGEIRWLHDRSMCIHYNSDTEELTLLGATKDITEKKLIEESLRVKNLEFEQLNEKLNNTNRELSEVVTQLTESERKYRDLIENSSIGVGISKGEKILFANKSLLDIYKIKNFEEFASRKITDYMPEDSKKLVKQRLRKYAKKIPVKSTFRHQIFRADGKLRTVQVTTNNIVFEGEPCRQVLMTDITSQLETEAALKQAASIFESIQIGIFIYRLDDLEDDRTLRMLAANPASKKLIGLGSNMKLVDKTIDELFPNLREKHIPQQYAEVVRSQIPIEFDDIHYQDDNVSPGFFSVKVFPLPDQCVGVSFENVSARRQAEKELLTRNQELNNFVYKISHDLKAPLSSIRGLLHLSKLEKDEVNYLPKIEERVNHLDSFIRDILSHSRNLNSAVIVEQLDLHEIIQQCIDELQYLPNADNMDHEVSISGQVLFSDKIRLMEICRNMISNAIKYQDLEKKKRWLKITAEINKDTARIEFEDNGIGIKPEYLDKIFTMFYRATEQAEGSGIGLYIVEQAVEKINGKIAVQSQPGQGTKFTISFINMFSRKANL
jgi:PAS domain S-box-containing protein